MVYLRLTSFLIVWILAFSAAAFSALAEFSDYALSSCQSFGDSKAYAYSLSSFVAQSDQCLSPNYTPQKLTQAGRQSEDRLYDRLAPKQIELQTCLMTQLTDFQSELQSNPDAASYLHDKTKLNLTILQSLEYQKSRLELSYKRFRAACDLAQAMPYLKDADLDIYRQEKLTVNTACPARKMSALDAQNILKRSLEQDAKFKSALISTEESMRQASAAFPFSGSPGLQALIQDSRMEAQSQAIQDDAAENGGSLEHLESQTFQAQVFNRSFDSVEKRLPNPQSLFVVYGSYRDELEKSRAGIQEKKVMKDGEAVFELTEDQRKQIFRGPVGRSLIVESLAQANDENRSDVQNSLCRLDARFGHRRQTTEAYIDVGIGILTLALAGIELYSGVGSAAAPATAAASTSRLKTAAEAIKDSRGFLYGETILAGASFSSGLNQALSRCRKPMALAGSCEPYSLENMNADLNLVECVTSAAMGVTGAMGLGISVLRNTWTGNKILEAVSLGQFEKLANLQVTKQLTKKAKDALQKIAKYEKVMKASISGRNLLKEKDSE